MRRKLMKGEGLAPLWSGVTPSSRLFHGISWPFLTQIELDRKGVPVQDSCRVGQRPD